MKFRRLSDHIRAVIRGSALNNDGIAKASFTSPSAEAQVDLIALAHAAARVMPETVSYVELHGTATVVGDPIEAAALFKCALTLATSSSVRLASAEPLPVTPALVQTSTSSLLSMSSSFASE